MYLADRIYEQSKNQSDTLFPAKYHIQYPAFA